MWEKLQNFESFIKFLREDFRNYYENLQRFIKIFLSQKIS